MLRITPFAFIALSLSCADGFDPDKAQPTPKHGATSFISADGVAGRSAQRNGVLAPVEDAALGENDAPAQRAVEEGDIYRVSDTRGLIFNLNAYRGLQVIDVADPSQPEIIGRLRVSGTPVEMYQVGDRLYLLLNNWYGYYGSRTDVRTESFLGGLVMVADISDPSAPRITGSTPVPGWIHTSRLTRGVGGEALYVVASDYIQTAHTYVRSFDVSAEGALEPQSEIDLGGWVTDIQATGERLMVASFDWGRNSTKSEVTVIDISDATGIMKQGATIEIEGYVASKHNMNLRDGVMRVVSGSTWSRTTTNHLETFDVSEISNPSRIDRITFGDNESLFATVFLDDRAFCVTYQRIDPFHAFSIDAAGLITPMSEFLVSGWNDFFRPVQRDQRLIGIGHNDENGRKLAVSLYDITDLTLADPLLARDEIDLDWGWSEASWDDRAFSVLEDATSIAAPSGGNGTGNETGELETGLVLLPFSGFDVESQRYVSAVQIFTFSSTTLTKRGLMNHGTQVRRSFVVDPENHTTSNLSEAELSLFDIRDPDAPAKLGAVDLAPNYTDVLIFGAYALRKKSNADDYDWWGPRTSELPQDTIEVVSRDGDVDLAAPVATIAIPARALLNKLPGDRLSVVSTAVKTQETATTKGVYTTTVELYSLADPTAPAKLGSLTTDELPLSTYWSGYRAFGFDCADCVADTVYGWQEQRIRATDTALVFADPIAEQQLEGTERTRYVSAKQNYWDAGCYDDQNAPRACTYVYGGIACTKLTRTDGTEEPETCTGTIQRCEQSSDGEAACSSVDPGDVEVERGEYSQQRHRYWHHYDLHFVDITGTKPSLAGRVDMDAREEAVSLLPSGSDLFVNYKIPHRRGGDGRAYARHFTRKIDLSAPASPELSGAINVPGEVIAVDGSVLITRDLLWGDAVVETSVDRLTLNGDRAELDAVRRFEDRVVGSVQLDGRGNALVTDSVPWRIGYGSGGNVPEVILTILDVRQERFPVRSSLEIDRWAELKGAADGRALFTVPGGVLVVNVEQATAPFAQAFFPVQGWPRDLQFEGGRIYLAAERFGLYQLDADTFNLLGR